MDGERQLPDQQSLRGRGERSGIRTRSALTQGTRCYPAPRQGAAELVDSGFRPALSADSSRDRTTSGHYAWNPMLAYKRSIFIGAFAALLASGYADCHLRRSPTA